VVRALTRKPAIVGHSFGGLMTQILAGRGLAAASVAMVRAQRTPMTAGAPPTSTDAPAQGRVRTPLN